MTTFRNIATSNGANNMRRVLESAIEKRVDSAVNVIERVQGMAIDDHIVRAKALNFSRETLEANVGYAEGFSGRLQMNLPDGQSKFLHENAVRQLAAQSDMPKKFIDSIIGRGAWGTDLIAHNFNQILHNGNGTKYLIRSVQDETRAILSDRYRRIDSRPLIDAFAAESQSLGLVPFEGYALDTTVRIRGILPTVFEPYPGEYIAFGLQWKNSDFGVGGHELGFFLLRPVCLNGAVGESFLRQVHLGGRLSEDIEFSAQTYQLDTQANVSALRDIVRHALGAGNIDGQVDAIRFAHEKNITPKEAKDFLSKNLLKGDADEVTEAFISPDIEMMPAGQNQWRLSNALSWVANIKTASGETEKALELQSLAGSLIPKVELLSA